MAMARVWQWFVGGSRRAVAMARRLIFGRARSRWRRGVRAFLLVLGLAYGGLFAFPGVLFAHHVAHGAFEVWSDVSIDPAIGPVLDDAERLLAKSPLHDPAMRHHVYLCNTPNRWALLAPGNSGSFGVTYAIVGHSVLNRSDVASNVVFRDASKHDRRPLSAVIAHERMHALIARRYGTIGSRFLPDWKVEGYCEVVAGGSSMDPAQGRKLIREGNYDGPGPMRYFRYRLMMQYLLEVEGRGVDEIMKGDFDEARVMADVRRSLDRLQL
jgi:hypothetical protein